MYKTLARKNLIILIVLLLITLIVTVFLSFYLTKTDNRPETFEFTVTLICLLEILVFGFFALQFSPAVRQSIIWPIYTGIGVVLGLYCFSIIVTILIFASNDNVRPYLTSVVLESLMFILVLGALAMFHSTTRQNESRIKHEQMELRELGVDAQEVYERVSNAVSRLDGVETSDIINNARKLRDKFKFCTPFGRPHFRTAQLEANIEDNMQSLLDLANDLEQEKLKQSDEVLSQLRQTLRDALRAMDKREKLLVR